MSSMLGSLMTVIVSIGSIAVILWLVTMLDSWMKKKEKRTQLDLEFMEEKHRQMLGKTEKKPLSDIEKPEELKEITEESIRKAMGIEEKPAVFRTVEAQARSADSRTTGAGARSIVCGTVVPGMTETGAKLALAQVKCIQCGASIEPGMKFCGHCGTQVPDNVQRAEIKIEDKAELERVAYEREVHQRQMAIEEKEAKIREVQAKKALHRNRNRWIARGILASISGIVIFVAYATGNHTTNTTLGMMSLVAMLVLMGVVADIVIIWIKNLIR